MPSRKAKRRASSIDRTEKVRRAPTPQPLGAQPRIWWALLLLAIIPLTLCQINSSDCWWHVQCGRSLWENWRVPDFHRFYFTPVEARVPDFRWTFLGDIIFYGAYKVGGVYAIQCLIVLIVFSAILLISSMYHWRHEWLALPLTIAFALGTYQVQLPRNAAFSIVFVVSLFWIFFKFRMRRIPWMIWLYPPVIGLWGIMHGSYLLGLVLVFLLLVGDLVDVMMDGARIRLSQLGQYALVICAALALTQLWNPATTIFLGQPFRYLQSQFAGRALASPLGQEMKPAAPPADVHSDPANQSPSATPAVQEPVPTEPAADRIKKFLNNSIWPQIDSLPRSGDFLSPFDRLDYRPVLVSFAFGFIALFDLLFCSRRCRFSLLLPLAGIFVIGMAYFRCTGYISAVSFCSIAMNAEWRKEGLALLLPRYAWVSISAAVIWIVAAVAGALPEVIGEPSHVFGFGKVPTFDDRMCDYVLKNYPDKNVFTTIVTGSFALLKWYPGKKVFADGFFAPHPSSLWQDYKEARKSQNPNLLHDRYGAELALVEHDRLDWNDTFQNASLWQPAVIGLGQELYRYEAKRSATMPVVLFTLPEARRMPLHFRRKLAANYYSSLIAAARFTEKNLAGTKADRGVFYGLQPELGPDDRHLFEEAASRITFE